MCGCLIRAVTSHTAYSEDALSVNGINVYVNDGGKQPGSSEKYHMERSYTNHDTCRWKIVRIGFSITSSMAANEMRNVLSQYPDFEYEKTKLQKLVEGRGYLMFYLSKFHCELNPVERIWCSANLYPCGNCNYSVAGLRKTGCSCT